jgi:tRNA (adenine37-N6)-methyltransferase
MKNQASKKQSRDPRRVETWIEPRYERALEAEPIGFLRSGKHSKFSLPHQPIGNSNERNVIELLPGKQFEQAVLDLQGFDRIWLLWWFHRHRNWKPQVLPPRGRKQKRGVFATRSPHRPNPIGITPVELIRVEKRRLIVGEVDLIDGTPILDIKPYVPAIDSFPGSRAGWVDEIERTEDGPPRLEVAISDLAQAQSDFLEEAWELEILEQAARRLAVDPSPHRTRRIRRHGDEFLMSCGAWRVFFRVVGATVEVLRLAPGYSNEYLHDAKLTRIADRQAQIAFSERWPDGKETQRTEVDTDQGLRQTPARPRSARKAP